MPAIDVQAELGQQRNHRLECVHKADGGGDGPGTPRPLEELGGGKITNPLFLSLKNNHKLLGGVSANRGRQHMNSGDTILLLTR